MTYMTTAEDKLREITRELGYRRFVYPKLVAAQKMSQKQADKQIALMEEIAADYQAIVNKERLL